MNFWLNEYFKFSFELNIELNHFWARFNVWLNNRNVSARAMWGSLEGSQRSNIAMHWVSDAYPVRLGQLNHNVVFGTNFGAVQDFPRGKKRPIGVELTPLEPPRPPQNTLDPPNPTQNTSVTLPATNIIPFITS